MLVISFAVLALAFSFTVRYYLITDTVRSLYRVAETLSTTAIDTRMHGSGQMRGAYFNLANRIAYAEYVLIKPDGTILDSSDIEAYPPGAEMLNEAFLDLAFGQENSESMIEGDRVAVSFPIILGEERGEASLVLYSQLDVLTRLNRSILGILAFAVGAGILVSVLSGLFVTRLVVGPLQQLKNKANQMARREFSGKLAINTGDEVEELADTFNDMASQLAEYDRSQKDFFQKASHELKTPLMSIQGYAEAIKDGIIPKNEKEKGLEIIIKESGRMKALVDEFIYLSKMETLNESYDFELVTLDEAVQEAIYAVNSLALEKDVSIETSIASGNNVIEGDPEKIHRLLLNILSNALHYARKNVVVILNNAEIVVEDDGPGFCSEDLEKVFDPFFHKSKKESSGLGLAISRVIVEKHGGTITVKNKPGNGAKIIIAFKKAGPKIYKDVN